MPADVLSGQLLTMEGETPQSGVVMRMFRIENGQPQAQAAASTVSDKRGIFSWFGDSSASYLVRCANGNREWVYPPYSAGSPKIRPVEFRFPPAKLGTWKSYGSLDGVSLRFVGNLAEGSDGRLLLVDDGRVFSFNGAEFFSLPLPGLPVLSTACVLGEKSGGLWLGTVEGKLMSYAAGVWREFNLPLARAPIRTLKLDRQGHLLVVHDSGLYRSKLPADQLRTSESMNSIALGEKLLDACVTALHVEENFRVWVGTTRGVFVQEPNSASWRQLDQRHGLRSPTVIQIHGSAAAGVWIGTHEGAGRWTGDHFDWFGEEEGLIGSEITDLKVVSVGEVWIGTGNAGLFLYDGSNFLRFSKADGLPLDRIHSLLPLSDGALWVGVGENLCRYSRERLASFGDQAGLKGVQVFSVGHDEKQQVWAGTEWAGVFRFKDGVIDQFTAKDGLGGDYVRSDVIDPQGRLWLCTQEGLSHPEGGQFRRLGSAQGLQPQAWCLSAAFGLQGELWVGRGWAGGGLTRFSENHSVVLNESDGLPNKEVSALFADTRGTVWIGSRTGLASYDGKVFTDHPPTSQQEALGVHSIIPWQDDTLLLGTGKGLWRRRAKHIEPYPTVPGLPEGLIWKLFRDSQGILWIGSEGQGVFRFDGSAVTSLTSRDGLAGDSVYDIDESPVGTIWLATNRGVSRCRPTRATPSLRLSRVVTDQAYSPGSLVPPVRPGAPIVFEYDFVDLHFLDSKRQFHFSIIPLSESGRPETEARSVEQMSNRPRFEWVPQSAG